MYYRLQSYKLQTFIFINILKSKDPVFHPCGTSHIILCQELSMSLCHPFANGETDNKKSIKAEDYQYNMYSVWPVKDRMKYLE